MSLPVHYWIFHRVHHGICENPDTRVLHGRCVSVKKECSAFKSKVGSLKTTSEPLISLAVLDHLLRTELVITEKNCRLCGNCRVPRINVDIFSPVVDPARDDFIPSTRVDDYSQNTVSPTFWSSRDIQERSRSTSPHSALRTYRNENRVHSSFGY